jgi:hypothetical protein
MAVVSGTNSGPVLRLKYTRMEIPKSVLDLLVSCEAIVESDGSFNAYRKRLISATPPILPYLCVILFGSRAWRPIANLFYCAGVSTSVIWFS